MPAQGDLNPRPAKRRNREFPFPRPDFSTQDPQGRPPPRQERRETWTNSGSGEEIFREIQLKPDIQFNPYNIELLVPEPQGSNVRRQPIEGSEDDNLTTKTDKDRETPQDPKEQPGQPTGRLPTLLHLIIIYLQLSQGRIEDLSGLLSELSRTPINIEMTSNLVVASG